ncbi:MAG: hypothetical protein AB8E15_11015 [Bdellovibrionales bacterium]
MIDYLIKVFLGISFLSVTEASQFFNKNGEFANPRVRETVVYILENFAKECAVISNFESKIAKQLEKKYRSLSDTNFSELKACYKEQISSVVSTQYLYRNLCTDLSIKGIPVSNDKLLRQFVAVNRYSKGIGPFHTILNDCLSKSNQSGPYIVEQKSTNFQNNILLEKLLKLKAGNRIIPNREELR